MGYAPPGSRMRQIKDTAPARRNPTPPRNREGVAPDPPPPTPTIDQVLLDLNVTVSLPVEEVVVAVSPPIQPPAPSDEIEVPKAVEDDPESQDVVLEPDVVVEDPDEPEDSETPSMAWKRPALNAKAIELGIAAPDKLGNKQDVLDAILAVLASN